MATQLPSPTLVPEYTLKRIPGGCEDDSSTVSVQVDLPADIAAVYPYVNAQLTGCAYNHAGQTLSWAEGRHKIVLRSRSLAVSQLPDWESAAAAAGRLVEFLNDVWAQRAQLQPRLEPWPQAAPLALLKPLNNRH